MIRVLTYSTETQSSQLFLAAFIINPIFLYFLYLFSEYETTVF